MNILTVEAIGEVYSLFTQAIIHGVILGTISFVLGFLINAAYNFIRNHI